MFGGLLQRRWSPLRSGILTIVAASAYLAAACLLLTRHLMWIPAALPLFAIGTPYGLAGLQAYLRSESKRREIRKAFSHYLSPAVLETLLAHPEKATLTGKTVEATVLFCDIAGFTALSERLSPTEVARLLNRCFDELTRIILDHQGTVDKFIGDAVMAFWGDPVPDPDHAFHACAAAIAIQERMRALREAAGKEGLPEVHVRIGVNAGPVIAGNMGSSELFNYTVLGDTVNVASRLVGANKERGTAILISGSVRERTGDRIEARPLEAVAVRGRSLPVEIYELSGFATPPPR